MNYTEEDDPVEALKQLREIRRQVAARRRKAEEVTTYTEDDIKRAYQTGYEDGLMVGEDGHSYAYARELEEAWKVYRGAYLL